MSIKVLFHCSWWTTLYPFTQRKAIPDCLRIVYLTDDSLVKFLLVFQFLSKPNYILLISCSYFIDHQDSNLVTFFQLHLLSLLDPWQHKIFQISIEVQFIFGTIHENHIQKHCPLSLKISKSISTQWPNISFGVLPCTYLLKLTDLWSEITWNQFLIFMPISFMCFSVLK